MPLAPATRLGPYEIIAPLGAGGMGEVYRARDLRLLREIALKVLPAALAGDADRQRRFEQEALATARLNHRNILQVFDVGQHEGLPYLVTELLEGETLRGRLEPGALPVRKAIELAIEIALGLGAAHEQGIIHRDLKPENLFITHEGRVKILDFGLARLVHSGGTDPLLTSAQTIEAGTSYGVVMGTVGYMSPEQVRGLRIDHRSDIFSFGAILYEILTGRRAFRRDTPADTLSAILSQDPPDVTTIDEKIPLAVQLVVRHCLEKSPGERFHSARDLAFQLEAITALGSGAIAAPAVAQAAPPPAVRYQSITYRRGVIYSARFAPDGRTILYSAGWEGGPAQVYMWRSESPEAIALPLPEAHLLAVSPAGEMALCLGPRWAHNASWAGTLATAPMFGGAPRQIENDVMWADFDPARSALAAVRDTPGRGTIESPLGNVLCETSGHFSHLRWSPSGELLAFLDHPIARDDRGSVAIVDRNGNKKTLTDIHPTIQGLAWSSAGDEIWFTAASPHAGPSFRRCLHAVNLSGERRFISGFPGTARLFDIARDGRLLMARDDDRIGMMGKSPGDEQERDLSWLDWSLPCDFSADGKWLLFEEDRVTADYVVGLRSSKGAPAIRLGEGSAKAISADGRWVLAQRPNPGAPLQLLPTGAGRERSIEVGDIEVGEARWLPDGQHVFCTGRAADGMTRAYRLDVESGRFDVLRMESPDRAQGAAVSADGNLAAASFVNGRSVLVPLNGGAIAAGPVLDAGDVIVGFSTDAKWLFVEKWGAQSVEVDRVHIDGRRREPWKRLSPRDASGVVLAFRARIALDGDAYAYACYRILSDLYVAEGLG